MASRSLQSATYAALDDAFIVPVLFVELTFDDGIFRVHTDLGDISTAGSPTPVWHGVGDLGSIDGIEEANDLTPTGIKLTLSGLNATVLNETMTQEYWDRPARILFGIRDSITGVLVAEPDEIWYGVMSVMASSYGNGQAAITVTAESELVLWNRPSNKLYTDAQMQSEYAGDTFFKYLPQLMDTKVLWGDKDATHVYSQGSRTVGPTPGHRGSHGTFFGGAHSGIVTPVGGSSGFYGQVRGALGDPTAILQGSFKELKKFFGGLF